MALPARALAGDVGPGLLGRQHGFMGWPALLFRRR
jgi:hypothetical protein